MTFAAVAMPMACILLNQSIGELIIDVMLPTVFSSTLILGATLYAISLLALVVPFCFVFGMVIYIMFVYQPAKSALKRRKEKMKKIQLEGMSLWKLNQMRRASVVKLRARSSNSPKAAIQRLGEYLFRVLILFKQGVIRAVLFLSNQRSADYKAAQWANIKKWGEMNMPAGQQGTIPQKMGRFLHRAPSESTGWVKAGRKTPMYLPPLEIANMMTSSTRWKQLFQEQHEWNNRQFADILDKRSQRVVIKNSPRKREWAKYLKTSIVFTSEDALIRLRSQLLPPASLECTDDLPRVPMSKLFKEFKDLLGYYYPDGIALTDLEKTEASEQFIVWKDSLDLRYSMGLTGGDLFDAYVNLTSFEKWFIEDLMSVIHNILSNRLMDLKFQRPATLKERTSSSILNSYDSIPSMKEAYSLDVTESVVNRLLTVGSEGRIRPIRRVQKSSISDVHGGNDLSNTERFIRDTNLNSSHSVTSIRSEGWREKATEEVLISDIYDNDPVVREESTRNYIRGSMTGLNFLTSERFTPTVMADKEGPLLDVYGNVTKREELLRDITSGSMKDLKFTTTEGKKRPLKIIIESASEKEPSSMSNSYFAVVEGSRSSAKSTGESTSEKGPSGLRNPYFTIVEGSRSPTKPTSEKGPSGLRNPNYTTVEGSRSPMKSTSEREPTGKRSSSFTIVEGSRSPTKPTSEREPTGMRSPYFTIVDGSSSPTNTTRKGGPTGMMSELVSLLDVYGNATKREELLRDITSGSMKDLKFTTTEGKKRPAKIIIESASEKEPSGLRSSFFSISEGSRSPAKSTGESTSEKGPSGLRSSFFSTSESSRSPSKSTGESISEREPSGMRSL